MTRKKRLTHDDAEALLSGRASDHPEVADVLQALHSGWSGPSEDRGRQHMTAIHEAAVRHAHDGGPAATASPLASAAGSTRRRVLLDRSRAVAFRLSSSVIALFAATMGLAHAGVDLPGKAAERAFSVVGIDLPNQSSDTGEPETGKSVAEDVKAAEEATEPGCERGRAVSTAASQNRLDEPKDPNDPCIEDGKPSEDGSARGSKATGEEKSSQGKEKAGAGKAKAEENKSNAPAPPASPGATQSERGNDNAERPERGEDQGQNNSTGNDKNKGTKAHIEATEELPSQQAPSIGTSSTNKR